MSNVNAPTELDYEQLCELGRKARRRIDSGRWFLGDLALEVVNRFGETTLEDFAKQTNTARQSMYAYRQVAAFYPRSRRVEFIRTTSNVTYTHFRHAMRLGDEDTAYGFLEEVAANNWTTDEAAYRLIERLTGVTPAPSESLDFRAVLSALMAGEVVTLSGRRYKLIEVTA